jgi:hypothetical protein
MTIVSNSAVVFIHRANTPAPPVTWESGLIINEVSIGGFGTFEAEYPHRYLLATSCGCHGYEHCPPKNGD